MPVKTGREKTMADKAVAAFLGLAGWYEVGTCGYGATYTRGGPLDEADLTAPIRVDLRPILDCDNPVNKVFCRPNLSLNLPDNNVRSLFEGCIGYEGTTQGHLWDGKLESLTPTDSVGLRVYLAFLKNQGAIITED